MASGFTFTVACPDPPAVVRRRVAAALTAPHPSWLSEDATFYGTVWDGGFSLTRNFAISVFEGGIPCVARGRIVAAGEGSVITVTTWLPWPLVLFSIAHSAYWCHLIWQRFTTDALPGGINWAEIAFLAGMAVFGWVLFFAAITTDERRFRRS